MEMHQNRVPRTPSDAGIAIGPILFIIAILGVLAVLMTSNIGEYGQASTTDRIVADIQSQTNLILSKINQCNMQYVSAISLCPDPPATCSTTVTTDPYPLSNTTSGTLVSALLCDPLGTSSLWSSTSLPPPTAGFNAWMYMDASATNGGRCIWTSPSVSNPLQNAGIVAGLTKVASKFSNATANDGTSQVNYNPASAGQHFVVWITVPSAGSENTECKP